MEDAKAMFLEGLSELHASWDSACENGGNIGDLEAQRDELAEKVHGMTAAEEILRNKINEKQEQREQVEEEIAQFNEIKEKLEALCERLGIENEELTVIKTKIEEECEAIGIENANLANLLEAAEAKAEERDALIAQKEENDLRKTEIQSELDKERADAEVIAKKMKKILKKKKKLELALDIIASDSD